LTSLSLHRCLEVTDVGVRTVSTMLLLVSLNLTHCDKLTDEAARAVSGMPALTTLSFMGCDKVTDAGLRAVSGLTCAYSPGSRLLREDHGRGRASSQPPRFSYPPGRHHVRQGDGGWLQALLNATTSPSLDIESGER